MGLKKTLIFRCVILGVVLGVVLGAYLVGGRVGSSEVVAKWYDMR